MNFEPIIRDAEKRGFKKKGRHNLVRKTNDVLQLINFQKSNYSDNWYVNFSVWPEALGHPPRIAEHLFPLRGRIEDILESDSIKLETDIERFLDTVDQRYSSLDNLRLAFHQGRLNGIYVQADLKSLLTALQ